MLLTISVIGCKKKSTSSVNRNNGISQSSTTRRIIYDWDLTSNTTCFLLQGHVKCWQTRLVKLTATQYSIIIRPNPFVEHPTLKFSLQNLNVGKKTAPNNDISYVNNSGKLFTNFDSAGMNIIRITKIENNELFGEFNFRIRNLKGKWMYFTQGLLRAKLP